MIFLGIDVSHACWPMPMHLPFYLPLVSVISHLADVVSASPPPLRSSFQKLLSCQQLQPPSFVGMDVSGYSTPEGDKWSSQK